jgi:glycosyltransferase involved in cell wall biosynthesis
LHVVLASCTRWELGGADRDFVTLLNALDPHEFRVTWVGVERSQFLRPLLRPEVVTRIVDVGHPLFTYVMQQAAARRSGWLWTKIIADHVFRLRQPVRRLLDILRGDRVDLVVANSMVVTLGAALACVTRKPHVWCIKECLDPTATAARRFARWVTRLSSAVVVPSRAAARPFPAAVHLCPDGNDLNLIRAALGNRSRPEVLHSLGVPVERPVVAQVGNAIRLKGQHVTAEAFVRCVRAAGRVPFTLLFLGPCGEEMRRGLESILAHSPVPWRGAVQFLEFAPDDYSLLAAADIVVHPSVLPDTFPNAVREAMLLGKAVVGSRTGGIPEMITHGETGLLVEPGDAAGLAAAIEALVHTPARRAALGVAARMYACGHFDIVHNKDRFTSLFQTLAGRADRRPGKVALSNGTPGMPGIRPVNVSSPAGGPCAAR